MTKPYEVINSIPLREGEMRISYKASTRMQNGLKLEEPIIMARVIGINSTSRWFDADHVARSIADHRGRLIESIDEDWTPNSEGEEV